jgi:Arginase family
MTELILAPTNLGLRPTPAGLEPGCWAAPAVLESAGLSQQIPFVKRTELARPKYSFEAQPGTGIRNGRAIRRFKTHDLGVEAVTQEALKTLNTGRIDWLWMHVDLDVLDQRIMPAVDSPGEPGLDFNELACLLDSVARSGRLLGVDVTIYDPELDPSRRFAPQIVNCLGAGLQTWATR